MNKVLFIIDCDNFSYNNYNNAIKKINNQIDDIEYKIILFGNFTSKLKNKWIRSLNESKIKNNVFFEIPILKKKNITDHVIIVEVMEILFNESHDFFVFASDDVDFIPLYQKIKKYNKTIWQISQNREPNSLTDDFIDNKINLFIEPIEDLYKEDQLILIINESIDNNTKEDGSCYLGDVKYWLDKNKGFNLEKTQFKKFSRLIKSLNTYELIQLESETLIKKI